ncbi:efflux RND transporter periplasmic adaptor subunit [Hydrogenophaga sp. PAMC20947]|uniref:HlyD family secretion protein n=1 Tax=Hydrogenophaga sp. PAMC20947 TaxID=2565558 RepID=UPI00109DB194|nr:efflux RND transporter periplasmic adaptor subunit [Hydrogenophaga sp. PAMC20947]QCB46155.1 biotin/lipoyl-binding protein [Hydrogenophaga sp. PAMC20947]
MTETTRSSNPARKKALTAVATALLLGGVAYGAYWALVLNHFETTDNAYVQGNVVQVTPQLAGTVLAINVDDTDHVKAGQWLVRLDPADAQIALEQAEANLAQTVRQVRTLYANNRTQQAQIALRDADLSRAQAEFARMQDDVNRRQPLVASGAVGREEFNHVSSQLSGARSSVEAARSAVLAAREQLSSNESLTAGTSPEEHPSVKVAASKVREAALALQRTDLVAPVDGYVARRNVQLGQRVQAGSPLLSVIALSEVWVEANFKESQLTNLRLEQPVELTADVYGKKVIYHGVVEGLGAGTGAAFALLPAQNATGNWIKVVQRVPVRVKLDAAEVAAHPLRVGLSMEAKVDISKTDGRMLAEAGGTSRAMSTAVFAQDSADADARVQRIIAGNSPTPRGRALAKAVTRPVAPVKAAEGVSEVKVGQAAPVTAATPVALVN